VLADVTAGRVTPAAATEDYAVALDATGTAVDHVATEALRRTRHTETR